MEPRTNILFVDDETNVLSGLRRMLRSCRNMWDMHFVSSGQDALEKIAELKIDVVISDMKMPEMDGATLLTEIAQSNPEIVRLILSGQAEKDKITSVVGIAHQFLSKPCHSDELQSAIKRICRWQGRLVDQQIKNVVTQIDCIPCLQENFIALSDALNSGPDAYDQCKKIIGRDVGLASKIVQLVSSSFFGTPQPKNSVSGACDLLGYKMLRELFFEANVFKPIEAEKLRDSFWLRLFSHSQKVSRLAARIAHANNCSKEDIAASRSAGLFHSIGRLILSLYFPNTYADALDMAQLGSIALEDAEFEVFGSPHTDVGAFLLALWGLDSVTVNTIHTFKSCKNLDNAEFGPAAAVFSANRLIQQTKHCDQNALIEDSSIIQEFRFIDQTSQWRPLA